MRLGIVGMLPRDFRAITADHLKAVQALDLSAACFHIGPELLQHVQPSDCHKTKQLFAQLGMPLVQMGIGYGECLFDPNAVVRDRVVRIIERGIELARALEVQVALIRPGSLNPAGSYAPSRLNHAPDCMERLVATLRRVATKAEQEGQTIVIETYNTTIMNSPETNAQVVRAVGSERIRIVMDYVNHFQSLAQVFDSTARINHIFDVMGSICPVAHCKDIRVGPDLALHLHEDLPGEGELDIATAFRRWHALYPNGYMLLEHIPNEKLPHDLSPDERKAWESRPNPQYAQAARNAHRIAREAGAPIH
jgi:sugar phosphate isomerase/epimerase